MRDTIDGKDSENGIALYIKYVPSTFTQQSFEALLSKFGKILSVYIGKPSEKYLASQLVFSIVKVATMRDAISIMENVHRKPPLNLSVEFAKASEDKKVSGKFPPKPDIVQSAPAQCTQENGYMNKNAEDCVVSFGNEEIRPENSERNICSFDSKSERGMKIRNREKSLIREGKCIRCEVLGSKRCSVCKAWYCSRTCQVDDWYHHQQRCSPPPPLEEAIDYDLPYATPTLNVDGVPSEVGSAEAQHNLKIDPENRVNDKKDTEDVIDGSFATFKKSSYSFSQLMENTSPHAINSNDELRKPQLTREEKISNPSEDYKMPSQQKIPLLQPPQLQKISSQVLDNQVQVSHHQEPVQNHIFISKESSKMHEGTAPRLSCERKSTSDMIKETTAEVNNHLLSNEKLQKCEIKERKRFMKGELFTEPIEADCKYGVVVTWYEENALYVQLFTDPMKELMEDLTVKLIKHCSKAPVPNCLVQGEIICAFVPSDQLWYRGEVIKVGEEDKILVHFIDFGNTDWVPVNNTRVCEAEFVQTPILAFPVTPICDSDTKEIKSIINPIINDCIPILMDVKSSSPKVEAEFWDLKEKVNIFPPAFNTDITNGKFELKEAVKATEYPSLKLLQSGAVKPMLAMYDECKTTSLPLENNVGIVVLQPNSPVCCFVVPKASLDLYENLETLSVEMNGFCNSMDTNYYEPHAGEVCLAKYSSDGLWYRACCIELNYEQKSADLIFVDYGNLEAVPFLCICQMVDKFMEIPLIALHCQIKGFTLEEVKSGGEKLHTAFERALPANSTHVVNVVSKCQNSNVYTIEVPNLNIGDIKKEVFA